VLAVESAPRTTLRDAYAECRRIALGRYENFPVATWFLPKPLRTHLYAIYAYCRGVDDIGDAATGDRPALLAAWEGELRRAFLGEASDPRFVALAHTIRRFGIPPEPFERLIEANRRDQSITRYETFADLLDYCTYSANPVGELVLYVFGHYTPEAVALSDYTCTGLQLANHWQDVSVDAAVGRIYLPRDDMEAFGVGEEQILARELIPAFRRLMRFQVERARDFLERGKPLASMLPGRLAVDMRAFTLGGLAALDEIKARDYDVLSGRASTSPLRKAAILPRALLPWRRRDSR
jgi:squalene synthase HpnC